jgi:hypothetical protein
VNAIGAGTLGYLEGWTQIDIVYYAVISSTTIGYGTSPPLIESALAYYAIFRKDGTIALS